jgi:hypothetical protein
MWLAMGMYLKQISKSLPAKPKALLMCVRDGGSCARARPSPRLACAARARGALHARAPARLGRARGSGAAVARRQPPRAHTDSPNRRSVSSHWEAEVPSLLSSPAPPLYYDYYGFPSEAYEIKWPAPGATALADRVAELLSAAGISSAKGAQSAAASRAQRPR